MSGYLVNFIVYTAAMVGIIFLALFVYKKCSYAGNSKSTISNVEDCINRAPRKTLYVIRAGKERFLVASDVNQTSLISKLDENQSAAAQIEKIERRCSVDELPAIVDFPKTQQPKKVFKNIINNI